MPPPGSQDLCNISSDEKQPIKWMELPIMKFNEVAVPYHVNQLKNIKTNIQKCQRSGDWIGAHREQVNARTVVKQLKTLVNEMDTLRGRVIDSDVQKFDKMINNSREAAITILKEYIDLAQQIELPSFDLENQCNSDIQKDDGNDYEPQLQLKKSLEVSRLAEECQQQEKCAVAWENLQREIEEVHELYEQLANLVESQAEAVNTIESNVEVTSENVSEGERQLVKAAHLKTASYPLTGALIGSFIGGPVGFVAGFKLGGLVALTCSILGFTGGKLLKDRQDTNIIAAPSRIQDISLNTAAQNQ